MKKLLFICWDGPQVNYLQGLFLPIFVGLKKEYEIHIIQFSWAPKKKVESIKKTCDTSGVTYNHFNILRKPVPIIGSVITLIRGINFLKKYIKGQNIDIVMPRSTFPALMTLYALKVNNGAKLVFDADGLPLDERVDFAALRRSSAQYNFLKSVEHRMVKAADVVITRTGKAIDILTEGEPNLKQKFQVVTNGRDTSFFKSQSTTDVRKTLGIEDDALLLVYAGSLGPQYCVLETLKLYQQVRHLKPKSYLLILTGTPEFLNQIEFKTFLDANVLIRSVAFDEIPSYLASANVGLAIRQPSFSMQGVAPIKIGEYLLSGLPVVASGGIGDTDTILASKSSCYILPNHTDINIKHAAEWVVSIADDLAIRHAARELGEKEFSLEKSIELYKSSLRRLN